MRRLRLCFFAISFFIVSVLCSCGYTKNHALVNSFSADISIHSESADMTAKVESSSGGLVSMTMKSPESIADICFSWINSQLKITKDSLICNAQNEYLPQYCCVQMLYDILSVMPNGLTYIKTSDGLDIYRGSIDESDDFTLCADNSTGLLRSIKTEQSGFEIEFTNAKIKS